MEVTFELNKKAPSKGLEMSVVLKEYCHNFKYPTPFELHFSNMHKEWYLNDPEDYCERMQGEDHDLAAHFTIIKNMGIVLLGEPINSVFGNVPQEYYLDSIKRDIQETAGDLLSNPIDIVLNLCRVTAYIQDGLILSKEQGGAWGIENLQKDYQSIISLALDSYRTKKPTDIEIEEARIFCDDMTAIIFHKNK